MAWNINGLPKKIISECLEVDFETGLIYRKERPRNHFKTDKHYNIHKSMLCKGYFKPRNTGYVCVDISWSGKVFKLMGHKIVYALYHDCAPPDVIDHANQIKHDNRPSNLISSNKSHNAKNTKRINTNKSGLMGVWYDKNRENYQVYITSEGKRLALGRRNNFLDAACLRKSAELKYGFSQNHGRI